MTEQHYFNVITIDSITPPSPSPIDYEVKMVSKEAYEDIMKIIFEFSPRQSPWHIGLNK